MQDHRSAEAVAYRRLYKTARWQRIREYQLAMQPLCERCLTMEVVEPATVVHHANGGHKGDEEKFWSGPFESLCKPHHDSDGKREDLGQTVVRFDANGWPM
ncbi:HNH endonuclease [Aminobacter niigataensis]|uniref:HNH endonuclease n=1 Tax=Aminobacter niigataensis TaxID=83265 RepID=UPI00298F0F6A|nr:HNH endonuclease [Aminobacter niigataensis]